MSDGKMTYEDWLRGCVYHDGRHGYVTLPCDEVLKIADYIERLRADLTEELEKRREEFIGIPISFSHLKGTDECEKGNGKTMRLIDADALLEQIDTERDILVKDGRLGTEHILVHYVREFIEDAPTVDAVKATMPWTNPDGTETLLDEVSYEIGFSQGQTERSE